MPQTFIYHNLCMPYVQIPLDWHGPNQTGPDPTRHSVCVSGLWPGLRHVWFWLNSTTRARPDFVVDFPRKTSLEKPNLCKVGRWQRNCCRFFNYTIMHLRGCEFITEEEKTTLRVGEKVHPCPVRENSMENVTLYYRNLLLQKRWNVFS